MGTRHLTKAKTHVFANDDLAQVLVEGEYDNAFSKTKRELTDSSSGLQSLFYMSYTIN